MIKDKILLYIITCSIVGSFLIFLFYSLYVCFDILSKSKKITKNMTNYNSIT